MSWSIKIPQLKLLLVESKFISQMEIGDQAPVMRDLALPCSSLASFLLCINSQLGSLHGLKMDAICDSGRVLLCSSGRGIIHLPN